MTSGNIFLILTYRSEWINVSLGWVHHLDIVFLFIALFYLFRMFIFFSFISSKYPFFSMSIFIISRLFLEHQSLFAVSVSTLGYINCTQGTSLVLAFCLILTQFGGITNRDSFIAPQTLTLFQEHQNIFPPTYICFQQYLFIFIKFFIVSFRKISRISNIFW